MIRRLFLLAIILTSTCLLRGQCPVNIGFENGNFDNWELSRGMIDRATGSLLSLAPATPGDENFQLIDHEQARKNREVDNYGFFPTYSPNGSNYSVKMGLPNGGSDIFKLSYTFKVPNTQLEDYSIIYHYAVVLENPGHDINLQPQFNVQVFNVTDNEYVDCGAFQFVAASNLPGFAESSTKAGVYYKQWAPITLKLSGFADKTLRLEFTINDCGPGGHFGYAYLDINQNCTSPITGNVLCTDKTNQRLTAPYGFQGYRWFTADFSQQLGTENILALRPAAPVGTVFALEITPFPNQGCLDTLYTTVTQSLEPFDFVLQNAVEGCQRPGIDLSSPTLTTGSSPGMNFTYFLDERELRFHPNPRTVEQSGTYFVKASNKAGCTDIKPVSVVIQQNPTNRPKGPDPACIPNTIDLMAPQIFANNQQGLAYSYWLDVGTTKPVTEDLSKISKSGNYFLKATNSYGCSDVQVVPVSITPPPVVVVNNFVECGYLEMKTINPAAGSDITATATYWMDATANTTPIPNSHVFTVTTDYNIKVTSLEGCSVIRQANVTINPFPAFTVSHPAEVMLPVTVDISKTVPVSTEWRYTYWEDSLATKPLMAPERILKTGNYFIKATSHLGCAITQKVNVKIADALITPPNAFSPNGDGINDVWIIPLLEYYPTTTIEIFTRTGQRVYRNTGYTKYWDGKAADGKPLPAGTYYYIIKAAPHLKPISGSVSLIY